MSITTRTMAKVALAGVLAAGVALVGCATAGGGATGGDTGEATDATAGTEAVDWEGAEDAEDALGKAGLSGSFDVPESFEVGGDEFKDPSFAYVEGIAKATYERPASMVEIRRGTGPAGTVTPDAGIAFDSTETFDANWEAVFGDLIVHCHGDEEGKILYAEWYSKDDPEVDGEYDAWSIHAIGLGGEDIPMTEEELGKILKN